MDGALDCLSRESPDSSPSVSVESSEAAQPENRYSSEKQEKCFVSTPVERLADVLM